MKFSPINTALAWQVFKWLILIILTILLVLASFIFYVLHKENKEIQSPYYGITKVNNFYDRALWGLPYLIEKEVTDEQLKAKLRPNLEKLKKLKRTPVSEPGEMNAFDVLLEETFDPAIEYVQQNPLYDEPEFLEDKDNLVIYYEGRLLEASKDKKIKTLSKEISTTLKFMQKIPFENREGRNKIISLTREKIESVLTKEGLINLQKKAYTHSILNKIHIKYYNLNLVN